MIKLLRGPTILFILILLLCLSFQVSTYTLSSIVNPDSLQVTKGPEPLILVPKESTYNIKVPAFKATPNKISLSLFNNLESPLYLKVDSLDRQVKLISSPLLQQGKNEIILQAVGGFEEGAQQFTLRLLPEWNGGRAELYTTIKVNVKIIFKV